MRRWPIMVAALLLIGFLPTRGAEIGKLQPVRLLYVYKTEDYIAAATDTGDKGIGSALEDALKDLEMTTPGYIFLDTVEMLVITGETAAELPQLCKILRPSVQVCSGTNGMDPEAVSGYLNIHPTGRNLQQLQNGMTEIPQLYMEGDRYRIEKAAEGT